MCGNTNDPDIHHRSICIVPFFACGGCKTNPRSQQGCYRGPTLYTTQPLGRKIQGASRETDFFEINIIPFLV